tara:strand:+ start:180 stop:1550 length:1371 start_codon:yes stop_codon:yes gene_type:complete
MKTTNSVNIIGGGLAGSEAAWLLANFGIPVTVHEMRPKKMTEVHKTENFSELVCSNSFRSDDYENNAVGLLHQELRILNSLIMDCADKTKIPAGGALAVDRDKFSSMISSKISNHNLISINREEIKNLNSLDNSDPILIATGPLTSESLANSIISNTGENSLAFFDAIAPIVYFESIDMSKAWFQSRYDKGDGKDYINCPLSKEEYFIFVSELLKSKKIDFKKWEKETPYFEGCMPIEVMAERGIETLRHGPLKPFGLTNEHDPSNKPYAVIQLRQDNTLGTLWNIVGFQTKMTYEEQKRVFKTIPGLENANFARLGGLHRNTFINSPSLLNNELSLKSSPNIYFAGQITGVEGYVESSAIGLLAGLFISLLIKNKEIIFPPNESALGSLLNHVTNNANRDTFQPMNINFGLFPNIISNDGKQKKIDKRLRRNLISQNALDKINEWAILINKIKKI